MDGWHRDEGIGMKGRGIREERETVIRWDEAGDTASIWTASETVYKQLIKRGYVPFQDNGRSAQFEMPKQDIKLPRPKMVLSEKRRAASLKAIEAARNARFRSGTLSGDRV